MGIFDNNRYKMSASIDKIVLELKGPKFNKKLSF